MSVMISDRARLQWVLKKCNARVEDSGDGLCRVSFGGFSIVEKQKHYKTVLDAIDQMIAEGESE